MRIINDAEPILVQGVLVVDSISSLRFEELTWTYQSSGVPHFCLLLREVGLRTMRRANHLRSHCFLPTQRQEILRPLDRFANFPQQLLQIFIPIDKINIGSIHNQQV